MVFSILMSQFVPMYSELQETRYGSKAECESGCNYLLYHLRCHKEIKKHEIRKQRMWGTFYCLQRSRLLSLPPSFSVSSSGSAKVVDKDT